MAVRPCSERIFVWDVRFRIQALVRVPYPVPRQAQSEVQQKGTIDHKPVYVREVVKPAGNGDRAGAQSPLRRPYFLPC